MMRYLLVLLLTLNVACLARAVEVKDLYVGKAPVPNRTIEAQQAALSAAFDQILVKLTGKSDAPQLPELAAARQNPDQYVEQFQTEEAAAGQLMLNAYFDRNRVNRLLRQYHLSLWGDRRPLSVVWVAEQTHDGRRLTNDAQQLQPMLEQARRRGVPLLLPVLDLDDISQVGPSDIWGFFDQVIIRASRRYDAEQALAVKLIPYGNQVDISWQAYDLTGAGKSFSGQVSTAQNDALPAMVNQLADQMAASYAVASVVADDGLLRLEIHNVDSLSSFLNVERTLNSLAIVDKVQLISLSSQQVVFDVTPLGSREDVEHSLDLDPNLERLKEAHQSSFNSPSDTVIKLMWQR